MNEINCVIYRLSVPQPILIIALDASIKSRLNRSVSLTNGIWHRSFISENKAKHKWEPVNAAVSGGV